MPHDLTPSADTGGAAETATINLCGQSLGNGQWCNREVGHGGDCWQWVAAKERVPDLLAALREENDRLRARLTESETKAAESRERLNPVRLRQTANWLRHVADRRLNWYDAWQAQLRREADYIESLASLTPPEPT